MRVLLCLCVISTACDSAAIEDAGTDADVVDAAVLDAVPDSTDASVDALALDSGMRPPIAGEPGGPISAAPIVGCTDAERPARRDDSLAETCEAVGRCWFVAPEGDDSHDGTFANPFRTPQQAIRQVAAGDIVYLRGGVYDATHGHPYRANVWDDPSSGTRVAFVSAARISLPDWAGGENYDVTSGAPDAPIIVRSFPGERACADDVGPIRVGLNSTADNSHWQIENITIKGASIEVGGGADGRQVHDILIRGNEVYDYTVAGGGNPGLVRVNRGDQGGPSAITIESNILHDLVPIDPDGVTRDWASAMDAQHFGAVTTLSCETYLGAECGGNGSLAIVNNRIYRSPQAFFFKNPSNGPVQIRGNVIRDTARLGIWAPSNITLEDNLVIGAGSIRLGGTGGSVQEEIFERIGHNLVVRNNTFVGIDTLLQFRIHASGHTVTGNVIQGLSRPVSAGSWDFMGLIFQSHSRLNPDTAPAVESSQLASNTFDDNCYVTDEPNFLAYGRRFEPGDGTTTLTHMSLDDARSALGFDATSDIASASTAFADFDGEDYTSTGSCSGRGARIPEWFTPRED